MLIINADDYGIDIKTTNNCINLIRENKITRVSLMVFMKDSERAAKYCKENGVCVGLHLNFTSKFRNEKINKKLSESQKKVSEYLKKYKFNQFIFNPFLIKDFEYIFKSQWNEFYHLCGKEPNHLDGHEHMHLCMNMILNNKYPIGIKIRRNFTFSFMEKNPINRLYRHLVDCWLKKRFKCTEYFFSLKPIKKERISNIISLSKKRNVELMVHPGIEEEYNYLMSKEWENLIQNSC